MDEEKIKNSFRLAKEDIKDVYNKIQELSDRIDELRMSEMMMVDKLVQKADKKSKKQKRKNK